jgi:DNA topoisomerase-3
LPVRRLWISSLTDEAIRQGFSALRPGPSYDALGDAARCRSEADWLVGMNATRAVTLAFRATAGGNQPTTAARSSKAWQTSRPAVYSIGRVQTPTLAILVRREQEIRAFQPRDYWEVRATLAVDGSPSAGPRGDDAGSEQPRNFTAQWTIKPAPEKGGLTRLGLRALADEVVTRNGAHALATDPDGPVVESLVHRTLREPPPQLFDLTSLQRTANRRYGLSASRTLEAAQTLYERHKVLTYPRTDSRHLPQDLVGELPKLFAGLAKIAVYFPFAQPLLGGDSAQMARSRRVFDGTKVHDHHAIIPTGKVPAPGALNPDEQRVFDLVARRFLGVFHPDAEFALAEAVIRVGAPTPTAGMNAERAPRRAVPLPAAPPPPGSVAGWAPNETLLMTLTPPPDRFIARGRIRTAAGWQAVAGFDERKIPPDSTEPPHKGKTKGESSGGGPTTRDRDDSLLPPLRQGQRLNGRFEAVAHQTRPPPRHSEATLLGAMESAGREIDDEALRAAMKDTGLGTPATRAATIETLVKRGFVAREGKQIAATPTGIALIERLPVPMLASPELTGAWEARLSAIARGKETRAAFMTDIGRYVREITNAVRGAALATPATPATPAPVANTAPRAIPRPEPNPTTGPVPVCPRCRRGAIMAGNRGWGCSEWRDGCAFVVWFEIGGKRITDTQLRDLLDKGKTRKGKWPQDGLAPRTGRLVLDLRATRDQGAARFLPE